MVMMVGVVRVKFAAVFLGPTGVGLVGIYYAIEHFAVVLAGMGINQSGVREISAARGTGDEGAVSAAVGTVRWLSLRLAILGGLLMGLFALPISHLTFKSSDHVFSLLLLGGAVFVSLIASAQRALLQGFRRIRELASATIISSIAGSVGAVCWYFFLGADGIAPSLLTIALITLLSTWFYSRKVEIRPGEASPFSMASQARGLIKLGWAFMWNGLLLAALAYLIRMIVLRDLDLTAVGIYSAAYGISAMIVKFVLNAMGTDYFPRLSEVSNDRSRMVELVNEQAEVALLLGMPAVLGLMLFAPWLVQLLYTSEFSSAVDLIEWFSLGCFGRIVVWPLGFIMLALKEAKLFAITQTVAFAQQLILVIVALPYAGLEGVALVFACSSFISYWISYMVARSLIQFRWSTSASKLLVVMICFSGLFFTLTQYRDSIWCFTCSTLLYVLLVAYSLRGIYVRSSEHPRIRKISSIVTSAWDSCMRRVCRVL